MADILIIRIVARRVENQLQIADAVANVQKQSQINK